MRLQKFFQEQFTPTSNHLFPSICEVKVALRGWIMTSGEVIKKMAEKMLKKFDRYWEVIEGPMEIAIVLDPRYKLRMVEWTFEQIYGEGARRELDRIKYLFYDLLNEYNKVETSMNPSSSTNHHEHEQGGSKWLNGFDSYVSGIVSNQDYKEEFKKYLREPLLSRTQNFDILLWWKHQEVNYPTLRLIAKDILAIPISIVISESAFSTSGRLLCENCSTLDPETVEALMCNQNWLRNEINGVKADNLLKGVVQAFMIMIFQAIQKNVLLKTKKGD
ncbi:Zinc finger BED domain-containing protein DAYSLEEPER [Linum perenne]